MNTPYATASLYVGDLEPNVTESMLFETFKKVGTVASIRVCRDSATRRSLGYAYVNFHNVADAERAIDTLNYTCIAGGSTPCRIMWSHRDPSLRRSGKGNIFIKNLDKSIDNKAFYDTFSRFGNILSCKIATDAAGKSKGFGFIHYETQESAEFAIEAVNGMLLREKKVFVGPFIARNSRDGNGSEVKFTNCFAKDLPASMTEDKLKELFATFGEVTSVVVSESKPRSDQEDAAPANKFGFVNFADFDSARRAVEELNGSEVEGHKIYVARAQKKAEREAQLTRQFEERKLKYAESNLYVKNLDETIPDEKLREVFEACGTIISVKVMRDPKTGLSKGFGFVCFSAPDEAHKAISELSGRMVNGKPLYLGLAQRKEVRAAQLQAQYAHRTGRGMAISTTPIGYNFPVNGMPGGGARFVAGYPPVMPRGRWPQGPNQGRGYPQPNPNYVRQQGRNSPATAAAGGAATRAAPAAAQPGAAVPGNAPAGQPGYVISQRAQNPAPPAAAGGVAAAAAAAPENPQGPSLADLSDSDRKQVLGEFLYPQIEKLLKVDLKGDGQHTGKITGMLLESLDHGELVHLLDSPQELQNRVEEAVNVLKEHYQSQQQAEGE